jgi:C4-dicarboxylate-specific signal transduction histidine kinase
MYSVGLDAPPWSEYSKHIRAERAGEIIGHLRGFLRTDDAAPSEVSISRAIAEVLQIIEPEAARRGIVIERDQSSQPLSVRADRVHLQQVLLNLALNGLDAMTDGLTRPRMIFRSSKIDGTNAESPCLIVERGFPRASSRKSSIPS